MVVFDHTTATSPTGVEQLPCLEELSDVGFFGLKKGWLWANTADMEWRQRV